MTSSSIRSGESAKVYTAPTLKVFGSVQQLTAAGTNPNAEGANAVECSTGTGTNRNRC